MNWGEQTASSSGERRADTEFLEKGPIGWAVNSIDTPHSDPAGLDTVIDISLLRKWIDATTKQSERKGDTEVYLVPTTLSFQGRVNTRFQPTAGGVGVAIKVALEKTCNATLDRSL